MADYLLDGFKYIEGPLKAGTYEVGDWQFIATAPDGQTWNLIRVLDQETVAQYACKQG